MRFNFNWRGALVAAAKAIWPFLAGAFGGMLSGCSIYGTGVGATL